MTKLPGLKRGRPQSGPLGFAGSVILLRTQKAIRKNAKKLRDAGNITESALEDVKNPTRRLARNQEG